MVDYTAFNLPLPNFILISIFGRSPSTLRISTSPFFPFLFELPAPFGSRLCLLNGLSSLLDACNFRFLPASFLKRESTAGARRNLTILLRFFDGLEAAVADADKDAVPAGRGAGGAMLGFGDGAALDGRDIGAGAPLAVFVLILSLGAGSGIGDAMAGGVAVALGGAIGAGAGRAEAFAVEIGGFVGRGTGVLIMGAGVACLEGGAEAFLGCISGTSGVDERVSVLTSAVWGAGEARIEDDIDAGDCWRGGENTSGNALFCEGVELDAGAGDAALDFGFVLIFNDSFGPCEIGLGACACAGGGIGTACETDCTGLTGRTVFGGWTS